MSVVKEFVEYSLLMTEFVITSHSSVLNPNSSSMFLEQNVKTI
jgi:hypothetical protein